MRTEKHKCEFFSDDINHLQLYQPECPRFLISRAVAPPTSPRWQRNVVRIVRATAARRPTVAINLLGILPVGSFWTGTGRTPPLSYDGKLSSDQSILSQRRYVSARGASTFVIGESPFAHALSNHLPPGDRGTKKICHIFVAKFRAFVSNP